MKHLLAVLIVLSASWAHATTYYVGKTSCSDSGACTSSGAPCCTINAAIEKTSAGDTVEVGDGVYSDSTTKSGYCDEWRSGPTYGVVIANKPCTAAQPCTLRSTNMHGASITYNHNICVDDSPYWTIERFALRPVSRGQIILLWTDELTLQDLDIKLAESQKTEVIINEESVYKSGFTMRRVNMYRDTACLNNETWDPEREGRVFVLKEHSDILIEDSTFAHYEQMGLFRNATDITIRRNKWLSIQNHGIECHDCYRLIYENNIVAPDMSEVTCQSANWRDYPNARFVDMYCGKDVIVRNNTFTGNGFFGVYFLHTYDRNDPGTDCDSNSTLSACTGGGGGGDPGRCGHINYRIYNNLFGNNDRSGDTGIGRCTLPRFLNTPTNWRYDYNHYWDCANDSIRSTGETISVWQTTRDWDGDGIKEDVNGYGSGSIGSTAVPTFVDYDNGNYRLVAGSSLVDAGTQGSETLGSFGTIQKCATEDFDGNPRVDGLACDIGAFEYQSGASGPVCGNEVREPPSEECDAFDFGGATCVSLGFDSGAIGCNPDCTYNTSGCVTAGAPTNSESKGVTIKGGTIK